MAERTRKTRSQNESVPTVEYSLTYSIGWLRAIAAYRQNNPLNLPLASSKP